jgi:hypothetical protein
VFCDVKADNLRVGAIAATVELALDAVAMMGRPGYRSGIRPNHWMPGRDYTFMGSLIFADREWLTPGEKFEAKGRFIIPEQDLVGFVPGLTWQVGEGRRIVGSCTLLAVDGTFEPLPSPGELARLGSSGVSV